MQIRNILQKKPFYRIAPPWSDMVGITDNILNAPPVSDRTQYIIRTQIDFLREYDIAGHKINSRYIYPDKVSTDENGNKSIHPIARVAVAFQQEIVKKHLTYLCGNDIEFSMPISNPNESDENQRSEFKSAWVEKNMETAFYASMKADKITGDCAFCGILNKGKFQWRVFSFLATSNNKPLFLSLSHTNTHTQYVKFTLLESIAQLLSLSLTHTVCEFYPFRIYCPALSRKSESNYSQLCGCSI